MTSSSVVFLAIKNVIRRQNRYLHIDICYSDSSVELSEEFVPRGEEFAAKLDLLGVAEEDKPVSCSRSSSGLSVVLKVLISQHLVGALYVMVLAFDHWGTVEISQFRTNGVR